MLRLGYTNFYVLSTKGQYVLLTYCKINTDVLYLQK